LLFGAAVLKVGILGSLAVLSTPDELPVLRVWPVVGVAACEAASGKMLSICHLETGEVLTSLELLPGMLYKYSQVFLLAIQIDRYQPPHL
jgi:hypothetical protein